MKVNAAVHIAKTALANGNAVVIGLQVLMLLLLLVHYY